ncbi:serine/threonine-protein kinase [Cellulosimicrobium marinum]|uniref:serine/threonine-protein kinase n=1 Tax=Cellulosimicrobium marinum TaxID=1638992 RepID=UPI001E516D23|nr:serine/threonine-protein kinase [Cellulosimicrobium marinum]MCB7135747.1 serine/threonine protein kinase [Cellulosimicrobium marinum]
MKPSRGLHLGDRYRLVRRIAVGGMGEVWVAADDALGREVAVKVLRSEYAGNEDFLNRLRTEARNSAALSHPNIAQMYDYGEQDRSGYLVMELVVGEPMADLLEREPVLPPSRLLPILSQTARGLHAAHVAGVVHRDVKPGNILIDRSGTVKITDFGVSLAANQVPMTATGMVMGTAQYLSPEQAVGQAATGASDVYALGIVAYESVVGNRPFTGSTPVDIAVAHVNEPVPPLPSSVDPELAQLIMTMLEKDPTLRPPSAVALAQVLDRIAERLASDPWAAGRAASPARRARRARADSVPDSMPDDAPEGSRAGAHTAPREGLAPVITPIVIPATVRDTEEADPGAARAGVGHAAPTNDAATAADRPAAALPWERPTPPTPATPSVAPSASGADGAGAPRSYPPRREMHGAARTRRPAARAATRPGRSTDHADAATPAAPATRAEMRRQAQDASARTAARRTSTTTGQRIGGLTRGMTWPLVALLGLLLVVLVATVVTGGDGGDGDAAGLGPAVVALAAPASPVASGAGVTS